MRSEHGVQTVVIAVSNAARLSLWADQKREIQASAVLERADSQGNHRLVLYVVPARNFLRESIRRELDEYGFDDVVVTTLSRIPRKSDGSIDERALGSLRAWDEHSLLLLAQELNANPAISEGIVDLAPRPIPRERLWLPEFIVQQTNAGSKDEGAASDIVSSSQNKVALSRGTVPRKKSSDTLVDRFLATARKFPSKGINFIGEFQGDSAFLSYSELARRAKIVASGIVEKTPHSKFAVIQCPTSADYFVLFWACVLAGVCPVTVSLSPNYNEDGAVTRKLSSVWGLLGQPPILTTNSVLERLTHWASRQEKKALILTAETLEENFHERTLPEICSTDVAFCQLTSGSTGVPKCIQETHGGIISHIDWSTEENGYSSDDVTLNWLQMDHVVPLLTFHIRSTCLGCSQIELSTSAVLQDPSIWLDAIDSHRVTHTWSPNFGLRLVSSRIADMKGSWDLSSLRIVMNAGEQVTRPVIIDFLERLAPYGLRSDSVQPAFGMAEVCTCMTYNNKIFGPHSSVFVSKRSLNTALELVSEEFQGACNFVSLGPPMPGVEIRIADCSNELVTELRIGRLQIRGEVVTPGYVSNPQANDSAFVGDGWFNTGDLGFIYNGELYITGREAEIIVINGVNYYCHEIEESVQSCVGVEPTNAAAIASVDDLGQTTGAAVFFVCRSGANVAEVVREVARTLSREFGIEPSAVVPLGASEFPKTTSGKIQRKQLQSMLCSGAFRQKQKESDLILKNQRTLPACLYEERWERVFLDGSLVERQTLLLLASNEPSSPSYQDALSQNTVVREYAVDTKVGGVNAIYADVSNAVKYAKCHLGGLQRVTIALPLVETSGSLIDDQTKLLSIGASLLQSLDSLLQDETEILVVTRGAFSVHGDKTTLTHAAVRGWLASAEREFPRFKFVQIDLAPTTLSADFGTLNRLLSHSRMPGKQCAVTDEGCWVPCWLQIEPPSAPEDLHSALPARGFYVVTGGLGGVGFEVLSDLAQRLNSDILIVGRTPEEEIVRGGSKAQRLQRLRSYGTTVFYASLAEPDIDAFKALVERAEAELGRKVDGLIHLAGLMTYQLIADFRAESARELMVAKVAGIQLLHDFAISRGNLALVAFTSMNAVIGGRGLSSYGAANSLLQSYMGEIRRKGKVRSAHCIAWSAWQGVGMNEESAQEGMALATLGLELLAGHDAIGLFNVILHQKSGEYLAGVRKGAPEIDLLLAGEPQLLDAPVFHYVSDNELYSGARIPNARDAFGQPYDIPANQWLQLPRRADGEINFHELRSRKIGRLEPHSDQEARLYEIFAHLVGGETLAYDDNFFERGLDSIRLAEGSGQVARQLGVRLPMEILFQHPSVEKLAAHLPRLERLETQISLHATRDDEGQPFPLRSLQESYCIGRDLDFDLGGVAAHVYREFDVEDADLGRLEEALNKTISEVPMLRATFRSTGEQEVLEKVPHYAIKVDDLRGRTDLDRRVSLDARRTELCFRKGALDWPLFNVFASRIDDRVTRLHIDIDMLIADWHSIRLVMNRWLKHYLKQGSDTIPTVSFRNYVVSTSGVSPEAIERGRSYWSKRILDFPGAPKLPMVGLPSRMSSCYFHRRQTRLDRARWNSLIETAQANGTTPTSVLLTLFSLTLERYSASREFSLILTLFDRPPVHPQINWVVGDFTSTLLFEHSPRSKSTFTSRVRSLNKSLWQDLDHRQYDGVSVLRDLLRSHQDDFDWVRPGVVYTSALGLDQLCGPDLVVSEFGREVFGISQTPQVWLDHIVFEEAGELVINWDSVDELFPDGLLDSMFESYVHALEQLVEPERWNAELVVEMPETQRARRELANATDCEIPTGMLFDAFLEHAKLRPDATAIITEMREVSYGELARAARAVAAAVSNAGGAQGQLVGVALEKGWEQVACVLGIQMAGAAYLPLDPSLPRKRLQELGELGELNLVLTDQKFASLWEGESRARVLVWEALPVTSDSAPVRVTQSPTDLAYVIFTSGSTGVPKGVMISHQSALNTVHDINLRYRLNRQSRVFGISSLSFDLSVYDIFGPLSVGAALVLPGPEHSRDPEHWVRLIDTHRVTLWNSVPALMEIMVDWLTTSNRTCPSVDTVMMSGDWIPVSLPERIKHVLPNASQHSLGGATEGSIWSIAYEIADVDPSWVSIPYGKALRNQKMYVLDDQLRECPDWVQGEIYIGGIGVALGYWRDPERTAEQFIDRTCDRQRLYRTGDLGRMLPDGNIEFLGRRDNQVQVNGYRVELGEIEAAIHKHPDIVKALVDYRDVGSQKALVAYVVAKSNVSGPILRSWLGTRLPTYMVPEYLVPLEKVPLTQNGKVARNQLPEPQLFASTNPSVRQVEAGVEATIALILSELAGFEIRDATANFFDLGLTSRTLLLASARIGAELRRNFSPVHLFRFPSIQRLAESLTDTNEADVNRSRPRRGALARAAFERAAGEAPELKNE
jgi:amino acid adenylation domain-containing protein